jgi:hypothetical protein
MLFGHPWGEKAMGITGAEFQAMFERENRIDAPP